MKIKLLFIVLSTCSLCACNTSKTCKPTNYKINNSTII